MEEWLFVDAYEFCQAGGQVVRVPITTTNSTRQRQDARTASAGAGAGAGVSMEAGSGQHWRLRCYQMLGDIEACKVSHRTKLIGKKKLFDIHSKGFEKIAMSKVSRHSEVNI